MAAIARPVHFSDHAPPRTTSSFDDPERISQALSKSPWLPIEARPLRLMVGPQFRGSGRLNVQQRRASARRGPPPQLLAEAYGTMVEARAYLSAECCGCGGETGRSRALSQSGPAGHQQEDGQDWPFEPSVLAMEAGLSVRWRFSGIQVDVL